MKCSTPYTPDQEPETQTQKKIHINIFYFLLLTTWMYKTVTSFIVYCY